MKFVVRILVPSLFAALFFPLAAEGQHVLKPFTTAEKAQQGGPQEGQLQHFCATPHLMSTPEGRAALERYFEARKAGRLPVAPKRQEAYEIGQMATFNILVTDSTWGQAAFELRSAGNRWRAWLRADVPDQDIITDARFETMKTYLDNITPPGSYNPNQGVFQNDEEVFGEAPVYPPGSDGVVDILIYEFPAGLGAGFVSPVDFDPDAPDTLGNQAEVMYLDIAGFFIVGNWSMESVIAHEYQHVIMINYQFDPRETTFVNEGQSEYAQEMNGYPLVPPYYLLWPFPPEYNVEFFSWEKLNILDYTRASTWTSYVAERIGPLATGSITRSTKVGLAGYEDALATSGAGVTFDQLLADFHTANLIDDRSVDPRFGYMNEQRASEMEGWRVPSSARFDGYDGNSLVGDSIMVQPGAAEYLILENVMDLKLSVDVVAAASVLEERRSQMLVRAFGTDFDGETSMIEFNPSDQIHTLNGSFARVRIILAHLRPEATQLRANLEALWSQDPDRSVETVGFAHESALIRNGQILAFAIDQQGRGAQATMFVPPTGSKLDRLTMATYYLSQFGNGGQSTDAPRDFELTIWRSNGFGEPGEVFYSQVMDDPVPYVPVQSNAYYWFDVDLEPAVGKMGALPDTVFIGLQNTGTDDNYLVVWPSDYNGSPAKETGFIRLYDQNDQPVWVPLWDIQIGGGDLGDQPLNRTALPVKARFVIDNRATALEQTSEIPDRVMLEQNYPNPFNPATRIRFALPEASDVSLEVFDISGRRVATLLDGRRAAGSYAVTLDASYWTSGVYFYRLKAGGEQLTKRMVILK